MPASFPRLQRLLRTTVLVGAGCAGGALVAHAAPDANDPVARLLAERGLLTATTAVPEAAAEPSFSQQVRNGASDMVLSAMNFLGVPYRRGGNSAETGFDCSGFTRHIFEMSLGLVLPRRADDQASAPGLFSIAKAELKPGDLVFFNTLRRTFSHVGIYIGDGKFIHAPRAGAHVRVEDMRIAYWQQRFTGARRVDAAALDPNAATAGMGPMPVPRASASVGGPGATAGALLSPALARPIETAPLLP